ncbi:hypothetical protein B566_EDAN006018 [Ephemera danica]|nr:hypothetical protein B566_EDAN006018 [Ephemera danica]
MRMTPGATVTSQYAATTLPQPVTPEIISLKPKDKSQYESPEQQAVRRFTAKYDSYKGLIQAAAQRGDEDSDDSSSEEESLAVTEQERLQTESFFRGLKTQVFVSSSLANLYFGTTTHSPGPQGIQQQQTPQWELRYTGIPVVILDVGETRSRRKRRIQILLAERGSCFTLWRDTIDNLTSYRQAGPAFHTMYLSSDHRRLVGLSFDTPEAADELLAEVESLTSRPENISLSAPKSARNTLAKPTPVKRLPPKSQISQPCCFQHVGSVSAADHGRYFSLQTLVPSLAPKPSPTSSQNLD